MVHVPEPMSNVGRLVVLQPVPGIERMFDRTLVLVVGQADK